LSITHHIRKLLDIQDPNITFEDHFITDGDVRGIPCHIVEGKLTYIPKACEQCGVKNENHEVRKNGTQSSRLTLPLNG